jgi:hypothetical protein
MTESRALTAVPTIQDVLGITVSQIYVNQSPLKADIGAYYLFLIERSLLYKGMPQKEASI